MANPEKGQNGGNNLYDKPLRVSHLPARDSVVAVWARFHYSQTGHAPTDAELHGIFDRPEAEINDILIRAGLRQTPSELTSVDKPLITAGNGGSPQIESTLEEEGNMRREEHRRHKLTENERAFFMGLSFGDYQRRPSGYFGRNDLIIATQSVKASGMEMLRRTLGRYKMDELVSAKEYKVYVDLDEFGFFKKPESSSIPESKEQFAPFILGLLAAKLSEKEGRLTFNKQRWLLAIQIDIDFKKHFGFRLGSIVREHKGTSDETTTVYVRDIEKVLDALGNEESVSSLPFFEDVKNLILERISPNQSPKASH
ncbi:MAG: hypothetical protein A3C30_00930 [Candidatus Levybacteria bacterium RIFCSPHIGHO2_02_FULL_40_18]|nr:MAG: hypothetical protein A2869_03005 [Candidatus Levybacteria bacterium RIFCSPHIGHO2_01_FULL_40_58]OGH27262.1 MAG: hypothetical protein A3C30_00930 [Candidatus Levybacteria bacterium RIFCSPHIGHO2_02_FULL_40_18]OGH31121.1 MAG: hypothetical protein A3E43_05340 [Candidatus Levybacteria bacterium RIFCSPHIGHO2_12_FULL_40_31]OGH40711.1 MAG: hypothetical protein A2894_03100 [Candidatus Levybacteria bacterium RIFCSPLOWO2_01_FULL_40_64]OGH49350.1 MAG: hypothetical protein A3I54_01740 [Candidatus Lev